MKETTKVMIWESLLFLTILDSLLTLIATVGYPEIYGEKMWLLAGITGFIFYTFIKIISLLGFWHFQKMGDKPVIYVMIFLILSYSLITISNFYQITISI